MRRAESAGDRWSGQVCLPGGMEESVDADLRATAVRETHEELGFDLTRCSRYLGPLDSLHARADGGILATSISPFVYVQTTSPVISPGPEAAHAFWLPLGRAFSGELDNSYRYEARGNKLLLPSWRYEQEVVWGLTYNLLQSLLQLVRFGHVG